MIPGEYWIGIVGFDGGLNLPEDAAWLLIPMCLPEDAAWLLIPM